MSTHDNDIDNAEQPWVQRSCVPETEISRSPLQDQIDLLANSWPINAFPFGHQDLPPYWSGKTLLDCFAEVAMQIVKLPNLDNATEQQVLEYGKKCWSLATIMMRTRPIKVRTATEPGDANGR